MATARPLAAGPPTCRATSPNLNKDARIRRRPDKDEDRDRLKVGESAGAFATGESRPAVPRLAATGDTWGSPEQAPGRAQLGHEVVNAAPHQPTLGSPEPGQRSSKDLTG